MKKGQGKVSVVAAKSRQTLSLPHRERVGMWSAINNAVSGGWSTTLRLVFVVVIFGAVLIVGATSGVTSLLGPLIRIVLHL